MTITTDSGIAKQGVPLVNVDETKKTNTSPESKESEQAVKRIVTRTCVLIIRAITKDADIFGGKNDIFVVGYPETNPNDWKVTRKINNNNSPEFHERLCWEYDINTNIVLEVKDNDNWIVFESSEILGYSKINPKDLNGFTSLKLINPKKEPTYHGQFLGYFYPENQDAVLHIQVEHECM